MVSEMAHKYELMGKEGAPMEADDVRGLGCEAVLALSPWDLLRGTYAAQHQKFDHVIVFA